MFLHMALFHSFMGFPGGSDGKESVYNAGDLGSIPGLENPLQKGMAPVELPEEFHRQRCLAGYSPFTISLSIPLLIYI